MHPAFRSLLLDRQLQNPPRQRRRVGRVGVRFVRPVGELVWKSIMFALLDSIELFRRVRIRTIIGREHLAVIIPAKAVGIAQTAREDLDLWALGLRIEPPYASRQRHFAALIVAAIRAGLI